jgi:SNF2 family DNA or RNA helicase
MEYQEFIKSKQRKPKAFGFDPPNKLNPKLRPWQAKVVRWSLKRGRSALFEECGLGKTVQQLVWAEEVHKHTRKPVVVHCPVGVRAQTRDEAKKFDISVPVSVVDNQEDIVNGINLINYEKMHRFDASVFAGVVLDESSCLKAFTGKTKQQLCESYAETPYRLACTATPAPNDHMELGNHADFLGVMPSNEMLSRWFINDTMKAGGYRLRGHAQDDFWGWVSSWAVCVSKPSDIGGSDDGYILPELKIERHIVEVDNNQPAEGLLFNVHGLSATNIHEAKRLSCSARAQKTLQLVTQMRQDGPILIWCETNYEADAITKILPGVIEIRGSDSEAKKESALLGFARGEIPILLTKPSVAGFGMNWQICNQMIFAGLSFSFEQFYQAIRRCWRFGQLKSVTAHLVLADSEYALESTIARKESDHALMQSGMAKAMRSGAMKRKVKELSRDHYTKRGSVLIPNWMNNRNSSAISQMEAEHAN